MSPVSSLAASFHEGCRVGELRFQRCGACGNSQFYPRPFCLQCRNTDVQWVVASGHAEVVTWSRVHVALDPAWADHAPYIVALVRLSEGPTLMTNLVDTEQPDIGQKVLVRFQARDDGVLLPVFAPVDAVTSREELP